MRVENSLLMRTDATFSLNFLIYIQNIFLNRNNSVEELKFPDISPDIIFQEDFEKCFAALWQEVAQRISEDPLNDLKIFMQEKDFFFESLFVENEENVKSFNALSQSFEVWWNSFAGRFSIERSIDEKGQKLYMELADALVQKRITPQKELNLSLIYDDCLLAGSEIFPYFAIVSLKDLTINFSETRDMLERRI